jgi:hypothetical protein
MTFSNVGSEPRHQGGKRPIGEVPTDRPAAIQDGRPWLAKPGANEDSAVRLGVDHHATSGCQTLRAAGSIRHHWFDIAVVGLLHASKAYQEVGKKGLILTLRLVDPMVER